MAEIILSALLPIVFEKLASAALNKSSRSKEIQSQLKKLKTSLPQIEALLNDAAEKEIQDKRVKDWLKSLQHVAYDIDDVLDSLATDAIHRELSDKPAGGITRKVRKIIPACCTATTFSSSSTDMHHKLNDITTKLQQLYDEKNNLGLIVKDKRSKNINRIYQTSLLPPGIVGRQGEKEILLQKLLLADDHEPIVNQNNFSIVPIVGMGGIGKTTLARLLYNEPKVNQHFDHKSWVCVSDEFDSFNIGKVIFQSIAGEEKKQKEFKDLNLLQEALRNELAGKKILLVLDDVWSEKIEDWDTLVPPFHAAAPGSKIIITTRKTQLLQQVGNDNPYHLNKLSDNDALSLFAQHSLGATNFDSYPTLRSYGEGIVQKCDGLPLALKSLGTSLKTKTNEEDWNELLNSKIWDLKDEGDILPALRLSYQELSACLKQLFAYSSLFPKDYMFEKEDLILLWMAEGFLHKSTTCEPMEMERLGEKYFYELLSKSFFEYVDDDKSLFVMHDLMNDLATYVAGEFFVRLDIEMKNKIEEHGLKNYRHMSFVREEFMAFKKFKAFERTNSLRTFLAVPVVLIDNNWHEFNLSHKILVDLLPQLPLLRVLCLSNIEIDEVPESVGHLKHLRYLNLSKTRITHLPDVVCNLYNLQTLMVGGCKNLSKLPNSFLKLKNLRHFDIRDTPLLNKIPLGIGEMKSLQTLSKVVIGGENEFPISGLKNLKNLRRRVCIHGLGKLQNKDQAQEAELSLMKLSELVVEWSDVFDGSRKEVVEKEVLDVLEPHSDNLRKLEILSYGGTEFPKWVGKSSFHQLTDVTIKNCRNCVFLPPLGQLQSLKKLSIKSMDDVKVVGSELLGNGRAVAFPLLEILRFEKMPRWERWSINAVGVAVFPCLKELKISKCPKMAGWEVLSANADVGVFPCLEELHIKDCPKLVKVSLEALPSLRVLKVLECGDGVLESLVGVASSVTWLIISGFSEEFTCKVSLPLLRVLDIRECGEGVLKGLIGVASSSVTKLSIEGISGLSDEVWGGVVESLGEVEELYIIGCKEIRNLWESKEAEACKDVLVNLKKLIISSCEKLERLGFGGETDEEGEGSNLFLTSLRILDIHRCENLKHLSCPNSIQELNIIGCKNVEHLSCPGGGGWQKLKTLRFWECNQVLEEELEKQLLNIISNNNTNMLQVVSIKKCQYLKSITKYTSSFIQLTELEIEDCRGIESSFPNLQNLASLKHLEIINCSSMDGPPPLVPLGRSGGVSVGGVWPPKLETLSIGKLKRPISEWGPLPTSLVHLTLHGGFGSSSSSAEEEEEDVKSFPASSLLIPCSSLIRLELWEFKKMESRPNVEADQMWNLMADNLRETAKEVLGMATGYSRSHRIGRESWWMSEEVQTKVAAKLSTFKDLTRSRNGPPADWAMARERYCEAKKEAKKSVAQAKERAYQELYKKLDSKEGQNDIYKIAKARERRRRDLGNVKCIKDGSGRSIVNEEDIKKRWGEYFATLFSGRSSAPNEGTYPTTNDEDTGISQEEVRLALRKMGRNKAVGPDQIPIEAWRCLGDTGVSWLTSLFNKTWKSAKMPEEWRRSEVIPIYKNKGDVQICSNYRGIKLLSHTMKLWERVIEMKLRKVTMVAEQQFGFMPGRSSMEAIHIIRRLMEKYRERQKDLHFAFLDLEKAYDSVPRELIWKTLQAKGVSENFIRVIRDMYERAETCVRTPVGNTEFFPVEVGLHQGSALSPYLFTLILDELTHGLQEKIPWCLIFADDIVLVAETNVDLNLRLEMWKGALEDNGLRISREKTEYLRCDFAKEDIRQVEREDIRIGDHILHPRDSFRYLGSILHKSGRIDEDVTHRIQVGWQKWRKATGVMCDKRIPLKLKGKFYRVAIRPAMLYGSECWPITKAQASRMEVAEMRMLRWTCGKTMLDMIPTGVFRAHLDVGTIIDKMREGRLRWFGHVKRRDQSAPLRRVESIQVDGVRRRGRPNLRWEDRINSDLKELGLTEDLAADRNTWRIRIGMGDDRRRRFLETERRDGRRKGRR